MSIRARARGAYRLRRWALAELLNGVHTAPPTTEPAAWSDFLQHERCAVLLQQHLKRSGRSEDIGPEAAAVLASAAMRELQRVLSARSQLQLLAELAQQQSARVVVLKGGVALLEGGHTDLLDVDVLSDPPAAAALAERLDIRGYQRHTYGAPRHLEPRFVEGSVHIELHTSLAGLMPHEAVLRTAQPSDGIEGLFRPSPADHIWIMLTHSTQMHPDRRGRLRDLLLIRHAWLSAPASGQADVGARLQAHDQRAILEAMLGVALGTASPRQQRLLERDVPARYLFSARVRALTLRPSARTLVQRAARIIGGSAMADELRISRELSPDAASTIPFVEMLGARVPFLKRSLRQAGRAVGVYLAVLIAWVGRLDHRLAPLVSPTDRVR
jgi:hypothetical protein